MKRTEIINALTERGYKAQEQNILKNGVTFKAITISNEKGLGVVIYTEALIKEAELYGKSLDEIVSEVILIYKKHQNTSFNLFPMEQEFILSHVYIGLQKESKEDIEKTMCHLEGLEAYLYVRWTHNHDVYTMKLPRSYFADTRGKAVEAWEKAKENTYSETCILDINQVLNELCNGCITEPGIFPMFVVTNIGRLNGASAILNHAALAEFAKKLGVNSLIVMPSSVHEMIIVPNDGRITVNDASTMVTEINATQVSPEERLTDRAYVLEF